MTTTPIGRSAGIESGENRSAYAMLRRPGLTALAATLVLALTTGLPMGSAAKLIPQADDQDGPFLGI